MHEAMLMTDPAQDTAEALLSYLGQKGAAYV